MPEDYKGNPLSEDQNPNSGNQENNIPDWMKEVGWGKDSGTFDESKPVFDNIDDEDEIVPADIPAWLEDAAPEGFSINPDATPAFEGLNEEESYITTGDLMPRTPPEEAPEPADPVLPKKPEPAQKEPELDIPSWLKNLELDEDSQETAVAWLENMPEDLRATDEEKAASMSRKPETIEPPLDELAWIDEIAKKVEQETPSEDLGQAELSEDLVASELIPEQGIEEQLFDQEEIQSMESETPDWLQELSQVGSIPPEGQRSETYMDESPQPESNAPSKSESKVNLMPDWLSGLDEDQQVSGSTTGSDQGPSPTDKGDLPAWLEEIESEPEITESFKEESASLDWLDRLTEKETDPVEDQISPDLGDGVSDLESRDRFPDPSVEFSGDVSPNDETLNTQVPDWLSKIGDEDEEEFAKEEDKGPVSELVEESEDGTASWLDQIDKPIEDELQTGELASEGELMDWLESMDGSPEAPSAIDDLRNSLTGDLEVEASDQKPIELETAKYFLEPEDSGESLPDWLAEIAEESGDSDSSLESAIRHSDHSLTEEEKDFLSNAEETTGENSDWLAKLDFDEDDFISEPDTPAIKVDLPEDDLSLDVPDEVESDGSGFSGGILERLNDPVETVEPEVPQWLENLKKEEDPQETAILWLKQFVERGNEANLQDEIKRYTDELNPGDSVPKWMEDLKHEEDPQTTAMLWLEKLAGERAAAEKRTPPKTESEAGWLAELEKEAAKKTQDQDETSSKDFQDTSDGWLADLEIDEKMKSDESLPDWSSAETEKAPEGDTPPWMKATSPLEGDFHTDELAGSVEKEVEIPAWLAGYGEGEEPEEEAAPSTEPADSKPTRDEYAWVAETNKPAGSKPSKQPIDLNKAAISQLESILGISYQIAHGIVIYREKQGPYKELKDLLKVPEITDEQTIEILKPEVFIKPIVEKPKQMPKPAAQETPAEERLQLAKALLADSQVTEALGHYAFLIKKKKSIPQIINSLIQAALDNPLDIPILKTLGDAYMRIDKLDEALEAYSKAEDLLR